MSDVIYASGMYGKGRGVLTRLRTTIAGNKFWWDIACYNKRFNTIQEAISEISVDFAPFELISDKPHLLIDKRKEL
jgi:hypothetical protein